MAVVALIPVVTNDQYILRVTTDTMLYVLLAAGLNVAVGWAGILDLGYIAFYGFAAYLFAELSSPHYGLHWPTWASVPVVIVATIILGFLFALPTRRLSRRLPRDRDALLRADLRHVHGPGPSLGLARLRRGARHHGRPYRADPGGSASGSSDTS